MKAPTGKLAFAYRTIAALEAERDALAQRCRDLEAKQTRTEKARSDWEENATLLEQERDTLRSEVEQLREIREIASQCAVNGGYLCSADLIELRELLKK